MKLDPSDQKLSVNKEQLIEERTFVKSLINKKLAAKQIWFVVDRKWFSSWKEYVDFEEFAISTRSCVHPGPIDNSAILDESGKQMKDQLIERVDFEVLPNEIWDYLLKRYSIVEGQAPLSRPVIESGSFISSVRVEYYPLQVFLSHYKKPTEGNLERLSAATTLAEVQSLMREMFEISAESETRLYGSYASSSYDQFEDLSKTLSCAGVSPRQFIVISEKEEEKWPEISLYQSSNSVWSSGASGSSSYNSSSFSSRVSPPTSRSTQTKGNGFTAPNVSKGSGSSNGHTYSSRSQNYYEKGLCGLSNLGNTCFMNSALQCMSNCPELTKYFRDDSVWKKDLNKKNPLGMKGKMAESYSELIQTMWGGQHNYTAPRSFKKAVGDFAPRFSGYQQQDSQELMAFLLDGLHEDLNRIREKPYIEVKDYDGRPDQVVSDESWQTYKARNDSKIVDLFHGQLRSHLQCPNNPEHVSVTFDPFCYLSLPMPGRGIRTMTAYFVSKDCSTRPRKVKVKVAKHGSFGDLCTEIGKLLAIDPQNLIVAETYHQKFHKVFDRHTDLSQVHDKDILYVFEKDPSEDMVTVAFYFRHYKGNPKAPNVFGLPMMYSLPATTTYGDLYAVAREKISRIVKPDREREYLESKRCSRVQDQQETTDEPMESHDDDTSMEVCGSPSSSNPPVDFGSSQREEYLFKITPINMYVSSDKFEDRPDSCVVLKDRSYLALDFELEAVEKVLDMKEAVSSDYHQSAEAEDEQKAGVQLEDCLNLFSKEERLGEMDTWYCPNCKEHVQANKKLDIWKVPKYLVVHLKRFQQNTWSRDKLDSMVYYPTRDWDLSERVLSGQTGCRYDLIGVVNHYGGLGGGHYTAYAKNYLQDRWYYFDDASVSPSDEKQVVARSGYVLVYERQVD